MLTGNWSLSAQLRIPASTKMQVSNMPVDTYMYIYMYMYIHTSVFCVPKRDMHGGRYHLLF